MDGQNHLTTVDYVVFLAIIFVSLCSGLYHAWRGRSDQTPFNFMLGNRKLSAIPVGLSLMVSFQSAIMMQGLPTEGYMYGVQWLMALLGALVMDTIIAFTLVPFLNSLKMSSTNEYLEKRYKTKVIRLVVSVINNLDLYLGMALYAPALALEAAMGLPFWVSIVILGSTMIIYTVIGGIKAVVTTDVLQAVVMCSSILALLIQGTIAAGGSSYVFRTASENGRMNFFDFDSDQTKRHTFWSLFFGAALADITSPFGQITFQRISSVSTKEDATRMYLVNGVATFILCTLGLAEGLVIYAFYHKLGCDPNASKQISNPNQIVALVWTELFSRIPGLTGLFMAGIVAASLSTLSSIISSMSVMIWEDFVKPHVPSVSDFKATIIIKIEVAVIGSVAMCLPFLYRGIQGSLSQIGWLFGALFSSAPGIFLLGCLCPWANTKGAVAGALVATVLVNWVTLGQMLSDNVRVTPPLPPAPIDHCPAALYPNQSFSLHVNQTFSSDEMENSTIRDIYGAREEHYPVGLDVFYSISYRWFYPANVLLVVIVGSIVSYLTAAGEVNKEDQQFVIPLYGRIFRKWPNIAQRVFPCCTKYYMPALEAVKEEHGLPMLSKAENEMREKSDQT